MQKHRLQQALDWCLQRREQRYQAEQADIRDYSQPIERRFNKTNSHHHRGGINKGKGITLAQWHGIIKRQKYRCYWCRYKFSVDRLTIDHVTPVSKGGSHDDSNIVASCKPCNSSKGDRLWMLL